MSANWDGTNLTLTLSQPVNEKWVWALRNMGNYTSVLRKPPQVFRFTGSTTIIDASPGEVQPIVDHFKNWLPQVNQIYARKVYDDARRAEQEERERLQREIAIAERLASINKSMRI